MSKRLTETERLNIIKDYINKKEIKDYIVKETIDKDGDARYIVRKIDRRTQKEKITDQIDKLQKRLAKINNKENDTTSRTNNTDSSPIEQSE